MRDTASQLSKTTIILHWIVALSMIGLLGVGLYMEQTSTYALYPLHKSFGVIIFFVILARVIWRVMNGWPQPASQYQAWEHNLAKVVHWVLIIGTVAMPISGMMMSGAGGHGISVFGLELLASNPDPANAHKVIPLNKEMAEIGHTVHGLLGKVLIAAIVLHIAGALKHHLIDKDGTLRRMLGKNI